MSRESKEELRQRLLGDHQVQQMIAMRAYEIYLQRGGEPGREADDWFMAESEVLSFLIDEESRRAAERDEQATDATAQNAEERADTQSELGVWSPTEPASTERAPAIGEATGSELDAPAPKKAARTKAAASSKQKTEGAKKTPAKQAASKKTSGTAKLKSARRSPKKAETE